MGNDNSTQKLDQISDSIKELSESITKINIITKEINTKLELLSLQFMSNTVFPSSDNLNLQHIKTRFQQTPNANSIPISPDEYNLMQKYQTLFQLQGFKITESTLEKLKENKKST